MNILDFLLIRQKMFNTQQKFSFFCLSLLYSIWINLICFYWILSRYFFHLRLCTGIFLKSWWIPLFIKKNYFVVWSLLTFSQNVAFLAKSLQDKDHSKKIIHSFNWLKYEILNLNENGKRRKISWWFYAQSKWFQLTFELRLIVVLWGDLIWDSDDGWSTDIDNFFNILILKISLEKSFLLNEVSRYFLSP